MRATLVTKWIHVSFQQPLSMCDYHTRSYLLNILRAIKKHMLKKSRKIIGPHSSDVRRGLPF